MNRCVAFLALAAVVALVPGGAAAQEEPVLELEGFATNILGVGSGRSGDLKVRIDRWSSAEEVTRLREALAGGGSQGLASALKDAEAVGLAHTQRGGDLPLLFAADFPLEDGGRRLLFATAPIQGKDDTEVTSPEYLVVELRLGADGKGQGRTAAPSQVGWDEAAEALVVDRYTAQPVWISRVEVVQD